MFVVLLKDSLGQIRPRWVILDISLSNIVLNTIVLFRQFLVKIKLIYMPPFRAASYIYFENIFYIFFKYFKRQKSQFE